MRIVFLAFVISAIVFFTGINAASANDSLYCSQGDDFAGGGGRVYLHDQRAVPGRCFGPDGFLCGESQLQRQRPAH